MDTLTLGLLELQREGKDLTSKTFPIWLRRVYRINNYLMKGKGNAGINRRKIK